MPQRLGKTRKQRAKKVKKMGAPAKRKRENKGTTASFPLSGPLPALRRGLRVNPDSIVLPRELLK